MDEVLKLALRPEEKKKPDITKKRVPALSTKA